MATAPDGTWTTAHRVAWMIFKGTIPAGMHVLHRCDHRPCVEVTHLWIGTNYDNVLDKMKKGRAKGGTGAPWMIARREKTHCIRGHEFTPENTCVTEYKGRTHRRCRACINAANRKYRAQKKRAQANA